MQARAIDRGDEAVLWWMFWGLCALQLLTWTLAPTLSHRAPPLDVVEMYTWGREGVVATFKHPNGPGLVLEAARRLFGPAAWLAYLISQLAIVTAFGCVFALGRELLGTARGLAGTLLLTGLFYMSWPTPEFNHNVLQVPLWALVILALWRAAGSGRPLWWIVLGVAGGLALWAKYSTGLLLLTAIGWLLWAERGCFRRAGPWLALLCGALVAAPQAHFIWASDFLALRYALDRAGDADPWPYFLLAQIAAHGLLFAMAAAAGLLRSRPAATALPERPVPRKALLFLAWMGLGPALLALALGLFGIGLKDMWGTPMFNLSGLLLVAWLPGRLNARALRCLAALACALLVTLPCAYAARVTLLPTWRDQPTRGNYPQAAIASRFQALYAQRTGGEALRLVAGPVWEAGLIALTSAGASVMIDGSTMKSPWVSEEQLAAGALAVWPAARGPGERLAQLMAARGVAPADWGTETFAWSPRASARPMAFAYAIIPPRGTRSGH